MVLWASYLRDPRWQAMMAAAMREDSAEYLLTAHHLGDQAETILMRLAHAALLLLMLEAVSTDLVSPSA